MTTRKSDAAFLQARAVTKAFKVRRKGNGPLGSLGGMQTTALRAVDDVSLDIARGEVFAIVGESGSGKTTLANLLARVTVPTEGRIVLDGEEISRATGIDLRSLRRQIQIVFQDPGSWSRSWPCRSSSAACAAAAIAPSASPSFWRPCTCRPTSSTATPCR
jgi:ABC-type oligopeptide transport system ATPase subunit